MLDPLATSSPHAGRVDQWALAACFLSASIWRWGSRQGDVPFKAAALGGGAVAATGPFFWPSAVLCTPFLLYEAWRSIVRTQRERTRWALCLGVTYCVAGAALSAALLLAAAQLLNPFSVGDLVNRVMLEQGSSHMKWKEAVVGPLHVLAVYGPTWCVCAAVACLPRRGALVPIGVLVITLLLAGQGRAYAMREVYLLPSLLLLVATAWLRTAPPTEAYLRRVSMAVAFALGITATVVLRAHNAWVQEYGLRSAQPATALGSLTIPRGARVVDASYHWYYVGRQQQWRPLRNPEQADLTLDRFADAVGAEFLIVPTDWSLVPFQPLSASPGALTRSGFRLIATIGPSAVAATARKPWQRALFGYAPVVEYRVYKQSTMELQ